jgi:hypothetical protein
MKTFNEFLNESVEDGGGLTIFDIDETLFQTTAKIAVKKDGKVVRELSNQEYNTYELKSGEKYDFEQFKSAEKFNKESKVIPRMMAKAQAILKNVLNKPNSRVIIITARADFDDKNAFLDTFRKHGLDMNHVYVERAGNTPGPSAASKVAIIRKYLKHGKFSRVRLFDDAMSNLTALLAMKKEFPDVQFSAYLAQHNGSIKTIKEEQEFVSKAGAGEWGRAELTYKYIKDTPGQSIKSFKKYCKF